MNADEFNALYEVGIPVFAYPGARPPKAARKLISRTRSRAWGAAHGKPVVMVDGLVGWISLTHVDVVPEDEWETAKAADGVAVQSAPKDSRRRIYIDGKGDGWIDLTVDPETGERVLAGITNAWKVASADEVRSDTGDLREIGRCW